MNYVKNPTTVCVVSLFSPYLSKDSIMLDLIIRQGRLVDPAHGVDRICDLGIENGKVACIEDEIVQDAKKTIDACGKLVIPGIIDMHTHLRTVEGHPHAQRMVAMTGVCTALDMAGPLDNILDTLDVAGCGINIAILEAARNGATITSDRPSVAEQDALVTKTLEHGGIGIKLLGGHFPMDLDISAQFIEAAARQNAWVAWHAGNAVHGSNIDGMRDTVEAAGKNFLHVCHINSYCRGQVRDEVSESLEAIELLKAHPWLFAESYVSDLNGTRLTCRDGVPISKVTCTCLKKVGCEPTIEGMRKAILLGRAGICYDNGTIGALLYGQEGVDYFNSQKECTGCFSVNPAASRFLIAQAKREDKSFVVDCISTDGGVYPRNVIVEVGLSLVKFGAMTLSEWAMKSSWNGARALNLPQKGHLGLGADGDITVVDYERQKACATIVGGNVVMENGVLCGRGTTVICDKRGVDYLKSRGIACVAKGELDPASVAKRVHC